jgi:hypothetical protein
MPSFVVLCCVAAAIAIVVLTVIRISHLHHIAARYPWWEGSATLAMWLLLGTIILSLFVITTVISMRRLGARLVARERDCRGFVILPLAIAACMFLLAVNVYPLRSRQPQPLFEAIRLGDVEKARDCLGCGADPNERYLGRGLGRVGAPALFIALQRQEDELAIALLEGGANADCQFGDGYTALMLAAATAEPETVAALIEHGANVTGQYCDQTINRIVGEHLGDGEGSVPDCITALSLARRRACYDEAGAEIVRMLEAHQ